MKTIWLLVIPFLLSLVITPLVGVIAHKTGAIDIPGGRHKHDRIVPRMGGVAIAIAFWVAIAIMFEVGIEMMVIMGASLFLLGVGVLDDLSSVRPWTKLICQLLGGVLLVWSGIEITTIGNPVTSELVRLGALSGLITVIWIVAMINAVNLSDGIDGLVGGVSMLSSVVLALLSYKTGHEETAKMCLVFAGAVAGFLIYNLPPARIFLGDSGTMFIGFTLGVLGFLGGAKIATAILLMGIPLLDMVVIFVYRTYKNKPFFHADRNHIHFKLLDRGLSAWQVNAVFYSITATLGILSLFMTGKAKILTIVVLVGSFLILWSFLLGATRWSKKDKKRPQ